MMQTNTSSAPPPETETVASLTSQMNALIAEMRVCNDMADQLHRRGLEIAYQAGEVGARLRELQKQEQESGEGEETK